MMNKNNNTNNVPQWVTFIATADFWGDSASSQMSFRKNARIEVDVTQNHNNGWRWGKSGDRTGWFPEWAAEERSLSHRSHLKKGRSRDRIQPMLEKISETDRRSRSTKNGADLDSNRRSRSTKNGADLDSNRRSRSTKNGADLDSNRRSRSTKNGAEIDSRNNNNKSTKSGEEGSHPARAGRRHSTGAEGLSWREKLSIMAAARGNSKDDEDEDEEVSPIAETVDLKSYRNERSYKSPEAVSRLAEITGFSLSSKSYSSRSSRSMRSISTGSLSGSSHRSLNSSSNATFGSPPQQQKQTTKKLFGKFPKISRRRSSHTNLNLSYSSY